MTLDITSLPLVSATSTSVSSIIRISMDRMRTSEVRRTVLVFYSTHHRIVFQGHRKIIRRCDTNSGAWPRRVKTAQNSHSSKASNAELVI
jgi:hypothetical protein